MWEGLTKRRQKSIDLSAGAVVAAGEQAVIMLEGRAFLRHLRKSLQSSQVPGETKALWVGRVTTGMGRVKVK